MSQLQKTLTPTLLWGLGVGYVISGMYFGWNLGLEKGGTAGMAIATLLVVLMYICFTFCYAELACAIPKAGGIYDYCLRGFGKNIGFVAGIAQIIEFTLAPPAIAMGIGAYINLFFPALSPVGVAIVAYLIFTGLNIAGVKLAASFELIVTIIAIVGLLVFAGITWPNVTIKNLSDNALPNGWVGIAAAVPFAVWFFLGIEGMANAAEESQNPQRNITKGFSLAMLTLVVLCLLVFVGSVGISGWPGAVFKADGGSSDSPLPLALGQLVAADSLVYHTVVICGVFGLVASFHGLLMAAGRATYEMGKMAQLSVWLGRIHPKFGTPANALLANLVVGIVFLLTNSTADIIVLSVLAALTLYAMAAIVLIRLRQTEPQLERPFRVFAYPVVPFMALILALLAWVAVAVSNPMVATYYAVGLVLLLLRPLVAHFLSPNTDQ